MTDPQSDDPRPDEQQPDDPQPERNFRRLSESPIWQWQRQYFEHRGIAAWSDYEVPQFVTSNAFIAAWYARVLHRWIESLHTSEPVTILELGAGSGRFAFGVLRNLAAKGVRFRYIMSDLSRANVSFWRTHAKLQTFVEQGVLDFAHFDPEYDDELHLEVAGETRSGFNGTLIVIANYFFDGIPSDSFVINSGQLYETRLAVDEAIQPDFSDATFFGNLAINYQQEIAVEASYEEPAWNTLLRRYTQRLDSTSFLFPIAALRVIERLRRMAAGRLLVLSADHGIDREDRLLTSDTPPLLSHGSFSLPVNYHAIGAITEAAGGLYLRAPGAPAHLAVVALAYGLSEAEADAVRSAYTHEMATLGPDAFYTLKKAFEQMIAGLDPEAMLAFLQLGQLDPDLFRQICAWLTPHIAHDPHPRQNASLRRREWLRLIDDVWSRYYPIGEPDDLAGIIADFLLLLNQPGRALHFCALAESLGYLTPQNRVRSAEARHQMADPTAALAEIETALDRDPTHASARAMKIQLEQELCWREPGSREQC